MIAPAFALREVRQEVGSKSIAESESSVSVWKTWTAWILLLPLVFLACAGFPLSQNDPGVFLSGSASIFQAPSFEPFGTELQISMWSIVVLMMLPSRKRIWELLKASPVVVALMLLILLSSVWADHPFAVFRRGMLVNLTLLLGFYLIARFNPEERLNLILGIGIFSVITSFMTAVLLPRINQGFGNGWQGIFGNKNALAIFLFFFLSAMFYTRPVRIGMRIFRILILCGGVVLVGLSQSRGGWFVVAMLFLFVLVSNFVNLFERRNAVLITVLGLPIAGGLLWVFTQNLGTIAYAVGKDPGLSNRTIIWAAVWPAILKRPILGYGYGGFWNGLEGESGYVLLRVGTSLVHAHNGLLNLWLDIGLVGVALALFITLRGVWDVFTCLGRVSEPYFLWYGAILLMTLVGSIDESFFMNQNMLTTTLWVLACVELRRVASSVNADQRRAPLASL